MLDTLAKSDLFFFLTGLAVIIVTLLVLIALVYIIKILRDVEDITDNVREESEEIIEDIHNTRTSIKKGVKKSGKKIKSLIHPGKKKNVRKTKKK